GHAAHLRELDVWATNCDSEPLLGCRRQSGQVDRRPGAHDRGRGHDIQKNTSSLPTGAPPQLGGAWSEPTVLRVPGQGARAVGASDSQLVPAEPTGRGPGARRVDGSGEQEELRTER